MRHEARFWSAVDATAGLDGCWLWTRSRNRSGYGLFKGLGEYLAHRTSWVIANGRPIPDGMHVCHHCDNPPCVNPRHLFIGTNADNVADRVAKGRPRYGQEWHHAKLSDADVLAIRESSEPIRALGPRYGVAFSTISAIRRGLRYGRVVQCRH